MRITNEILQEGRSSRGGWSSKQLKALGVKGVTTTYKNPGWKWKLIGREVPPDNVKRFIALKDAHLRKAQEDTIGLLFGDIPEDLNHRVSIKAEIDNAIKNGH